MTSDERAQLGFDVLLLAIAVASLAAFLFRPDVAPADTPGGPIARGKHEAA